MRKFFVAALLLAACTRDNPLSPTDDGGTDGGGGPCGSHHDTASCQADANCVALGCPDCHGGQSFIGCYDKNGPLPGIGCPAGCPQPASCDNLDENACNARSDCHSVYQPALCECAECCCTPFNHCASGLPVCNGPVLCRAQPPDCGNPDCNNRFAVGVANGCYEGCVLASECLSQ